jgi:hypothetical protein
LGHANTPKDETPLSEYLYRKLFFFFANYLYWIVPRQDSENMKNS